MIDRTQAPRVVDQPEEGYFLHRLVKHGPQVPARIWLDYGIWRAEIDGAEQQPGAADPIHAAGVLDIWHHAERTTEAEYRYRLDLRAWALQHQPDHPAANPRKPIALTRIPPIRF